MASPPESHGIRPAIEHPALLSALLILFTILFYWKVQHFEFVGLDDHVYAWNNPYVLEGITWDGIKYVFTHALYFNFHPLTWASLMADTTLFGPSAHSYHRTSIVIHALNSALVFLFLRRATGATGPAAFAAAVFAVHPLNVEPVAWISSRKDVLSGFFFLFSLWAYCAIPATRTYARISAVFVAYALSLLAKPSVVAFPFVLLLLDYWPLARFGTPPTMQRNTAVRCIVEKAPLFALMFASLFVTAQSVNQSVDVNAQIPILDRAQDAIVNYALYLGKCFVPIGLSAQYPYIAHGWPWYAVAGSAFVLLAITAVAWLARRRTPYIAVGWLWFLGVMFPMCGILLVGAHSRADRYMYMPIIGVLIMVAWTASMAAGRLKLPAISVRAAALVLVAACAFAGWRELPHWANEKALAAKLLASHDWNPMGHYLMGKALEAEGDIAGALDHYQQEIALAPNDSNGHIAIAGIQAKLAAYDQAAFRYQKALELDPNAVGAYYGLGFIEAHTGHLDQARTLFLHCVELEPNYAPAANALAEMDEGRLPSALP